MFEHILSKNILLAPSLNQFLLWGLKLLDSDRNLRDNKKGREAMPQEWITTDYNKHLFLWKTYLFISKCKLCWLKLPNQWHVKPETTLYDSYQVRFTIRMKVLVLLWFVVVCFFVSLFLSWFRWKIHIRHKSITFLKPFPPEPILNVPMYSVLW